jgi:hypothetical protein
MTVFRWRWWRIGVADPLLHKHIEGWILIFGQIWWKSHLKLSGK